MSYQVLARKWRPRNFQEVVGQQHVLTALSNGLAQNRVHHAYLFSGTRGVGKTTIARILAKSLNCEQGVTAMPCGQCVHCQAIDQGRFVDLLEIDAASRTKVDDTRELLDNVQYKPAQGRYKVYLIDEVHMLSKHSFNALLKTLEEPPEYVKFLLATTDPQKLPITVLSRCLQFHLKAILPDEIEKQLVHILQHEQAKFDHAALSVIAKAADGSIRDALSLTDQALAFGSGNIDYQAVLRMLGTIDSSHLHYLLHFIASGNVQKVFEKIAEFVHLGADFAKLHKELASLCHQIAIVQMQNSANITEKNAIELLAERLTPEEVQLYYQISVQGLKDYVYAPNGKVAFEMTVMRLLAFKPANYIAVDENRLAETPEVQPAETIIDNQIAAVQAAPVIVEQTSTVPAQQQAPRQAVMAEAPAVTDVKVAAIEPTVTAPIESVRRDPKPIELQKETQEVAAATTDSVQQLTHSRNMLRSHRLKREEAKKSQATTVNDTAERVVAEKTATAEPLVDIAVKANVIAIENEQSAETKTSQPAAKESPVSPTEQLPPDELLPPIDSYLQDTQIASDSIDSEPSFAPETAFENMPIQEEPDPVASATSDAELQENSFFSDQQLDVPAIDIAKYVEDKLTDPWSLVIQQMQVVGLVKLLAKNSVMQQLDQKIILTLQAKQQHLLNNSGLCEQLQEKLKAHYGQQISMYIEIGNVEGSSTPVECEQQLFQKYLDNAKQAIKDDPNIQSWVDQYGASIYENSIIPL